MPSTVVTPVDWPFGTWEWNIATNEAVWSDELYRLFGFAPGAAIDINQGWLDHVHPDDRSRVRANVQRTRDDPAPHSNEFRIIRTDGQARTLRLQVWGNGDRRSATVADVTDRQQLASMYAVT